MEDTLTTALRLLANNIDCDDGVAIAVVLQAADEIDRLREAIRRLADQDATLSVAEGKVIVEMDATLTDAEREAVDAMAQWCEIDGRKCAENGDMEAAAHYATRAATLRGLLKHRGWR